MFLGLLSCLLLAKHTYSDTTVSASCANGRSTGATCTWSANMVQRDVKAFKSVVAEESSPDIQGWVAAHDVVGLPATPHPSLTESDVEEEIAKPSAMDSGEIHHKGTQSTLAASSQVSDDGRFVSPEASPPVLYQTMATKRHVTSPAASLASSRRTLPVNSDEAPPRDDLEDATANSRAGLLKSGFAWLQLVSRERIARVQRLQLPSGHIVSLILPILLISIIVMCAVIFLLSNLSSSEETLTSLPEVEQSRKADMEALSYWTCPDTELSLPAAHLAVSSAHSSPDVSEKSLPLSYAKGLRAPARDHLCPELIVPPASECTLVVPQLSARILEEPEATLTIQDTMGARLFHVSLSRFAAKLRTQSHLPNPPSHRMSFKSVHENITFAYCEVMHRSRKPGTGNNQRSTVVFQDNAGRYFAELGPCTEAGKEDHYIVSTAQNSHFYWRGTSPKTAVDRQGRLIAQVAPKLLDEPHHALTAGPGADMGLVLLSLIGTELLAEID